MDELYRDLDLTTEYGEWTVESILAEFRVNDMLDNLSDFSIEQEDNMTGTPTASAAPAAEPVYVPESVSTPAAPEAVSQAEDDFSMAEIDAALAAMGFNFDEAAAEPAPVPVESFELDYREEPDYGYKPDLKAEPAFDAARDYEPAPVYDAADFKPSAPVAVEDDFDIDPRFNLSGRQNSYFYDGVELDTGAEEDYAPKAQADFVSAYTGMEDLELPEVEEKPQPVEQPEPEAENFEDEYFDDEPEPEERPKKRGLKLGFGKKKKAKVTAAAIPTDAAAEDFAEGFYDYESDGSYAPSRDYAAELEEDENKGFPGFFEFFKGEIGTFLLRMKGSPSEDTAFVQEEDNDELGPEVKADTASKYYGAHVHSLRLRFRICLAVLLVMTYISVGLPMTGMLKTLPTQAAVILGLQLSVMLLCLDIVTGAAVNMARGRFGADSLAVLACVLTSIDALSVALGGFGSSHTPLCVLSSMSLAGVLAASLLSARGLRKSLRVPAIAKTVYSVSGQNGLRQDGMTLVKEPRNTKGFVHRSEEAPPDEDIFRRYSLFIVAAAVLCMLIICAVRKSFGDALFVFTAVLCPAIPVTALLCFALPFCVGSMRIFPSGAAIAGWSGLCDVGKSKNIIITDRDLFPEGTVSIETVRISGGEPQQVIAYAGTMMAASGSGIAYCFSELMEKNNCSFKPVENFEYLAGGGMRGVIDGQTILCGGIEFMRLMHVMIPYRLLGSTDVLLAVDGVLRGIFNLNYEGQPQIRKALVSLVRGSRHPIFAVRDFNITPEMLRECFDVATDGYDFPPYSERFDISEAKAGKDSRVSALVCREGLGAYSHMANVGRSMYLATEINLLLTLVSAILGVFIVMTKLISAGTISVGFMLLFMLLWVIPVLAVSAFMKV